MRAAAERVVEDRHVSRPQGEASRAWRTESGMGADMTACDPPIRPTRLAADRNRQGVVAAFFDVWRIEVFVDRALFFHSHLRPETWRSSNDPFAAVTHLPDITAVSESFSIVRSARRFMWPAARNHADVGA